MELLARTKLTYISSHTVVQMSQCFLVIIALPKCMLLK